MKPSTLITSHPNRVPTGDNVFIHDIASHATPIDSASATDSKKAGARDAKKKKKA